MIRRQVEQCEEDQANLNFLLITQGDESQNIRLFDGDVVIYKSPTVLREQLLQAGQSNLTPQFFQVYVSGRVQQPGPNAPGV